MSGILMMIIAIVVLGGAYLLYGRYLQNKWGIDPNAKTPAYEMEDGVDYVPADTNVVFGHQFASIAGAGPINGPIQAAIFGWLPVLLWILIGGVFFGAVQDFASMYASVKNKGRTIGYIIEEYIGKLGKKLFLLFCWLFCILGVAALTQMPKLRHMRWKTELTMYRPIRTSYSVTSLHRSQVPARSTDQSRQQSSDGFRYFCGS